MSNIPRKIFQTWEVSQEKMSIEMINLLNKKKEKNPTYKYFLYDSNDRENFIKNNFSKQIYDAYCRILPGAYKADLWRYCVLYIYGGVYIDIDTICIGKLDDFLLKKIDFICTIDFNKNISEGTHNLSNGFIASVSDSKILKYCIDIIVYQIDNNIIPNSKLNFSGPGVLGRAMNIYLNLGEYNSFIGKEGKCDNIYFLKFEEQTEYIKDMSNNILFQNKNGNKEIERIYNSEIQKINNFICWVKSSKILKPNKIAIFNGFPFHYEMFGYVIDYCVSKNIELDIYTETNNNMEWLKFYLLTFPTKSFTLKKLSTYEPINQYSKILLLTDDDFVFKNSWINNKVVCIDHFNINRRPQINTHIGVRYFTDRPYLDYCTQVYRLIDIETKQRISNKNIVIIGNNARYFTKKHINIIKNFEEYNFIFIDRNLDTFLDESFKLYKNFKFYNSISTIDLIQILKESDYIFITDINEKEKDKLSASIPLALNCLCTLIMPVKMNNYYKYKSVITYENEINIIEPTYNLVLKDLEEQIIIRNNIFDKYI
jgi:mannosyltransferase OCH1-like enzyme